MTTTKEPGVQTIPVARSIADPAVHPVRELFRAPVRVLFGAPVQAVTMDELVTLCVATVMEGGRLVLGAANAAKVVKMRADPDLRAAVVGCDLVMADGASLVWASRLLRRPLPERVAGIDLFERLLAEASATGASVYFLGAKQEVLDAMLDVVAVRYPGLRIVGARSGYFTTAEEPAVVEKIAETQPDYLFVGMGTPKKELFLARWAEAAGARVTHGVGGSFDVLGGLVKRAPVLWQRLGMEWFYRVCQEPRRMWRRYLVTNSAFLLWFVTEFARSHWPFRRR